MRNLIFACRNLVSELSHQRLGKVFLIEPFSKLSLPFLRRAETAQLRKKTAFFRKAELRPPHRPPPKLRVQERVAGSRGAPRPRGRRRRNQRGGGRSSKMSAPAKKAGRLPPQGGHPGVEIDGTRQDD